VPRSVQRPRCRVRSRRAGCVGLTGSLDGRRSRSQIRSTTRVWRRAESQLQLVVRSYERTTLISNLRIVALVAGAVSAAALACAPVPPRVSRTNFSMRLRYPQRHFAR
jgi:hypothetical protein